MTTLVGQRPVLSEGEENELKAVDAERQRLARYLSSAAGAVLRADGERVAKMRRSGIAKETVRAYCDSSTGEYEGTGERNVWELLYVAGMVAVILGLMTSVLAAVVFAVVVAALFSFAWATK